MARSVQSARQIGIIDLEEDQISYVSLARKVDIPAGESYAATGERT